MRKWGHVFDRGDFNTHVLHGTDSGLTSSSRAFHKNFCFAHTSLIGYFSAISGCHLGSVRSIFLRPFESHFTSRCPRNNLAINIGNGNNDVVK